MRSTTKTIVRLSIFVGLMGAFSTAEAQNVMQQLQHHPQTTHFAQALQQTNLDERLKTKGPFTLFAPSNSVFDQLTKGKQLDSDLLLNHIFIGMATERSLKAMSEVTCLSGHSITIKAASNGRLTVNSFDITTPNIRASNGVIHIIDGVIK